uniref:PAS domain-containing protein n=1 Tax=Altererythrobacter segetis TaxID=1104773 RepID=UPI00140E047E
MDTLRGNFDALEDSHGHEPGDDESGREAPPLAIGQDERRMQVRAYNHWASLLEDRNFPAIDDLEPGNLPDFGPYSVLLDFSRGIENPGIAYLGAQLAQECDISVTELQTLADVPSRSLLSRITDHYMQILANQAPIGFEAEFVNQRSSTILYRGILLPFSSDDETIDFIYGVINWKELADQHTSDELLLQVDQALEAKPESPPMRVEDAPLTDWADGPGAVAANDIDDDEPLELSIEEPGEAEALDDEPAPAGFADGLPAFSGRAEDYLGDDDYEEEGEHEGDEDEDDGLPRPKFGSLMSIGGGRVAATDDIDDADDVDLTGFTLLGDDPVEPDHMPDFEYADDAVMALDGFEADAGVELTSDTFAAEDHVEAALQVPEAEDGRDATLAPFAAGADEGGPAGGEIALGFLDPAEMELGDWLAAAREMAAQARNNEDRTRNALYEAIGRAYDFSLAAAESPADFEELVSDSGLTVQDRAPMTPVVKLVFGADYDKTRLTEYAAALSHAHRLELPRGSLTDYLRGAEGGLKGVVKAERQLRRAESGKADPAADSREALAEKLREMPAVALADIAAYGSEFALLMVRRSETGELVILGEVPEDAALVEKAAKKLVG